MDGPGGVIPAVPRRKEAVPAQAFADDTETLPMSHNVENASREDLEARITSLSKRLEIAESLLQRAGHLEAIARAATGGIHEFRNLLTGIQGHTRLLLEEKPLGDPDRDSLLRIASTSARAIDLLSSFRGLVALSDRGPAVVDLETQINAADTVLRMILGDDVVLDVEILEPANVEVRPGALRQMLIGLAMQAVERVQGAGMVRIAVERDRHVSETGDVTRWAVLTVADTGHTMTDSEIAGAMDPLAGIPRAATSLGVGLHLADAAARDAGGHVKVSTSPGGSRVRVYLPLINVSGPDLTEPSEVAGVPDHILVVDDDDAVRDVAAKILRRMGYRVTTADSGENAVEVLLEMPEAPDMLLSDIVMPGMNGRELSERFRVLHPDKPVLFMSAYTEDEVILRGIRVSEVNFLPKPFTLEGLGEAVRAVLKAGA